MFFKTILKPRTYLRLRKYRQYNPASDGSGMLQFIEWLAAWSTLKVNNIFEIGANFGQDAEYLALKLKVPFDHVYVFEAHPGLYNVIKKIHKFNSYNYAVYNEEKSIKFNALPINAKNTGISSLLTLNYKEVQPVVVDAIRMDSFMEKENIPKIDFLKIDVEGCSYEVLEGFGERLNDVNSIHIECEHVQNVYGQKNYLFCDIRYILEKFNFEMVFFQRYSSQSDSFWIKPEFLKCHST